MRVLPAAVIAAVSLAISARKQTIPPEALSISQVTVEKRQLQTRYFQTGDEPKCKRLKRDVAHSP